MRFRKREEGRRHRKREREKERGKGEIRKNEEKAQRGEEKKTN